MILGVNTILFGAFPLQTAFRCIAMAGYEGVELSAVAGMGCHVDVWRWRDQVSEIKRLARAYRLELVALEYARQDAEGLELAFQAAGELGIPVVTCSSGGASDDAESFRQQVEMLGERAQRAARYGVTLCVKPHVGQALYNTSTTLQALQCVASPALGINLDTSHLWRAGEDPVEALSILLPHLRHVHIRDCVGRGPRPSPPETEANGRGEIDLVGFVAALHAHGYQGAVCLEIHSTEGYELAHCCIMAAESAGHMRASLRACGAR